MHAESRVHNLLCHLIFGHVRLKKNLSQSRQDAKKTLYGYRDLRNNTRGSGRTENWKVQFRHWTAKR